MVIIKKISSHSIGSNKLYLQIISILISIFIINCKQSVQQEQQELQFPLKTDPFTLDLYHKFNSNQEFKFRGSILVRPKTEYRPAQGSIIKQAELSNEDIEALKKSSEQGDIYYLKASLKQKGKTNNNDIIKTTQTLVKSCSLYSSNFVDFITINLNPINDFLNINIHTTDPECLLDVPKDLSNQFNTTILIESGSIGPSPDTATYIKRLDEERQNKAKEAKEDNRSFFAKYWIYIVPAIIILMMFSGPQDQGGR